MFARAEAAGFACASASDHFHPWSERQGWSNFVWSWLGAAMERTQLPFRTVSAPGYRYNPAILAQAGATLSFMYPERLWMALGTGQRLNEAITGVPWPQKDERNARLKECVDIIRALWAGETVTHDRTGPRAGSEALYAACWWRPSSSARPPRRRPRDGSAAGPTACSRSAAGPSKRCAGSWRRSARAAARTSR